MCVYILGESGWHLAMWNGVWLRSGPGNTSLPPQSATVCVQVCAFDVICPYKVAQLNQIYNGEGKSEGARPRQRNSVEKIDKTTENVWKKQWSCNKANKNGTEKCFNFTCSSAVCVRSYYELIHSVWQKKLSEIIKLDCAKCNAKILLSLWISGSNTSYFVLVLHLQKIKEKWWSKHCV